MRNEYYKIYDVGNRKLSVSLEYHAILHMVLRSLHYDTLMLDLRVMAVAELRFGFGTGASCQVGVHALVLHVRKSLQMNKFI